MATLHPSNMHTVCHCSQASEPTAATGPVQRHYKIHGSVMGCCEEVGDVGFYLHGLPYTGLNYPLAGCHGYVVCEAVR